jgi:RNA polymerase sigma-70 factor (ECF subfamily)
MAERIDILVKEILDGNINSFDEIAKTYYSQITAIVNSIHPDKATTKDVVQEILLTIYKKLDCYKPNTHFSYWIKSIARNICYCNRKKWLTRITKEREYERVIRDEAKTPEIIPLTTLCHKLIKCLGRLRPKYKNTLFSFYYENKSIKDISKEHNVSEEQVKIRLHRGRKLIENDLKEMGAIK